MLPSNLHVPSEKDANKINKVSQRKLCNHATAKFIQSNEKVATKAQNQPRKRNLSENSKVRN
eukprot:11233774-Karenia_brevis.AAC.1